MRSPSRRKVSLRPESLRWPQAKQRWYVVSSLSLSGSCTPRPVYQPIWRQPAREPTVGSDCAAAGNGARGTLRHAGQRIAPGHARPSRRDRGGRFSGACRQRDDGSGLATSRRRGVDDFLPRAAGASPVGSPSLPGRRHRRPALCGHHCHRRADLGMVHPPSQGKRPRRRALPDGLARQLGRLIMDMSLVGRFDELGSSMAREPIDLVELMEPMVKDHQRRFGDLAIEFGFETPDAMVDGNAYWLHLALRELLDNAVRFRPGPTGRIDISLTEGDASWRIAVLDDGFGIEPQNQGQLFKRFARIETDANRHLVGMGIGLYLVQEVARAHSGRVLVDSRPEAGSEFTFELPKAGAER